MRLSTFGPEFVEIIFYSWQFMIKKWRQLYLAPFSQLNDESGFALAALDMNQ